jgi:hypothetical protein
MFRITKSILPVAAFSVMSTGVSAMGLRSFVALPLEKGGVVLRLIDTHNLDQNTNVLTTNIAYGISGTQSLFLALPYRISPTGGNRLNDLSLLYRHIVWQVDDEEGTSRLGLLGGLVVPTAGDRDARIQAGAVATFYRRRHEWDLDMLWLQGTGDSGNAARYDISWQYRVTPSKYPDWGPATEWDVVLELNGRWIEGNALIHQLTGGLQWIHRRWVLEGGIVQDLNGPQDTRIVLSTRVHF